MEQTKKLYGKASPTALKWFWGMSINEQNTLMKRYFPKRDYDNVLWSSRNISEMHERETVSKSRED